MQFAIVGAAVALPGADDLDRLRTDLLAGATHFDTLTPAQSRASGLTEAEIGHDGYVATAVTLPGADRFDREFFGMTAAEARWTDPQQRLLVTLTHQAVQSSGIDPETVRVGVYATVSSSTYLWGRVTKADRPSPARVDYRSLLGNDRDFVATRIAYGLGFTGPALTVQSACSSSLVALHQACLGLAYGDSDIAVVAAASLKFPQQQGYIHEPGGILSATGESRPFDAHANGTVRGSGGGVVVLRRLDEAIERDDNVLAVVAGTAVNNDGAQRMGYSAPSAGGQQDVLTHAVRRAGIHATEVGYVETHGTGTPIGDPIEFRALSRTYAGERERDCYLGAAKANYGHLDVAAGLVGLLKTVLVLEGSTVFPQPSFTTPNPAVALNGSGFTVPTTPVGVPDLEYAAVSSFGMGGTNGHAVLRRAPRRAARAPGDASVPITLSARSHDSLHDYRQRLAEYLHEHPGLDIRDVATTLARRTRHEHVWTAPAASAAELAERLTRASSPVPAADVDGRTVWLPPSPLTGDRYHLPLVDARQAPAPTASPTREGGLPEPREGDVHAQFLRLAAEELGVPVDADTDFFAAGGESMGLVSLIGKLTDSAGFRCDFDELDGVARLGELATILDGQARRHRHPGRDDLIVLGDGEPELYLYPPAGGTNFCYSALHRDAPDVTVAAFRPVRSAEGVEQIAAACADVLRRRGAVGPDLVVGGYSFGGNVAFEIARLLEHTDAAPPHRILLFDSFAPHAFGHTAESADGLGHEVHRILTEAAANQPEVDIAGDVDPAGHGVPDSFRTVWAANNRALAAYRPASTVSVPITLLRAATPLSDARARALGIDVAAAGDWAAWTSASVEVIEVPGDHYTLFTDRSHRAATADELARVLRAARTGGARTP